MRSAVITHALRTPIGRFMGVFSSLKARDLGIAVTKGLIEKSGISPDQVDEFIFGNARQAGSGPNIARQIAIFSGIPDKVPAYTVNKACASGLKSIILAAQAIWLNEAEIIIAGGTESMTNVPFMVDGLRHGVKLGDIKFDDGMYRDGFLCPMAGQVMGRTAENLVEKYSISRLEQDEYAAMSQQKCQRARNEGRFSDEIVPVTVKGRRGEETVISQDEHPRDNVTVEKLSKLSPVFKEGGSVHAGNSSGITDGASALLIMSAEKARRMGYKPMAEIGSYSVAGVDPGIMGIGPVPAIKELLKKTGMKLEDFDLIELNEAFAAQILACHRELSLPMDRVNVNGGAIALGHPIGATGARIVTTLLHEMTKRGAENGMAALCVSGGLGMAVHFKRD